MSQLMRVSILGTMPNGEVWSVNPVYRLGTGLDVPVSQENAQAIATAIAARTVPAGLTALMSTSTFVSGARVEARLADGTLQTLAEAPKATPTPGTGTTTHPFQTALVISLKSTATGARGRGRLYWPATAAQLTGTTLRLATAVQTAALSAAKSYLTNIETDIETTLGGSSLAVWSRTYSSLSAVASMSVGDVLDTQRRRRDQLIESVLSGPYP